MIVDLSGTTSGTIGKEALFSDLFASAVVRQFTGGFLIRAVGKDFAVFFRAGCPVFAGGNGFDRHFIGEILVRNGAVAQSTLADAIQKQAAFLGTKPLLGAMLVDEAGVHPDAVKDAMRTQTIERVLSLFGLVDGTYQSSPGENDRIRQIGVVSGGLELLTEGLRGYASDYELRVAADRLLGQAIQLQSDLPEELALNEEEKRTLRYLDKPRKPDQLERAMNNRRMVRVLLRLISMLDRGKLLPAAKAIPIPKATLLKGQVLPGMAPITSSSSPIVEPEPAPAPPKEKPPKPSSKPAPVKESKPAKSEQIALVEEMKALHATMNAKNHFDILGLKMDAGPNDIKKAYHALAKRYHPDAFTETLSEEVAHLVRDVAARINEANRVLSNDKSRAEYIALVKNDRVKGDARALEKIKEADVKFQMGVVMLRKKDYQTAREYLTFAVENDPENGEYKSLLAWAYFIDAKHDREIALEKSYLLMIDALKAKHPSAQSHYYMGQILKARGKEKDALFHFKMAARLDPKHTEAIREIRLVELRDKKGDDEGDSLLDKLFKR